MWNGIISQDPPGAGMHMRAVCGVGALDKGPLEIFGPLECWLGAIFRIWEAGGPALLFPYYRSEGRSSRGISSPGGGG